MYKKIIPVFVSIAMLWGLFSFPVDATGVERSQTTAGFGSYLLNLFTSWQKENPDAPPSEYDGFGRGGGFESSYMGNWHSDTAACSSSEAPGGYHYIDPDVPSRMSGFGSVGTVWEFCCLYCHEYFTVTGDSLSEAYKDYVDTFPATGITSSGLLVWQPTWDQLYSSVDPLSSTFSVYVKNSSYLIPHGFTDYSNYITCKPLNLYKISVSWDRTYKSGFASFAPNYVQAPISGYYSSVDDYVFVTGEYVDVSSQDILLFSRSVSYYSSPVLSRSFYEAGDWIRLSGFQIGSISASGSYTSSHRAVLSTIPLVIVPDSFDSSLYDCSSRPSSIIGNFGIVGDNGQITNVKSTTIINETNNTYTNPSTGTTSTITEWTYDYSDRSYNVTLESGDTITVTYGDEYITILEGDTTYNVYYIVEGSGGSGENPGTDTCKHDYTSTTDRDATCTVPGQMTYTCSLCGDTYSESIPAKGHTWTVLQTVTTEYDQEGNLLQQGYTIYQCSVCGEQYKDEAGTGPPSSGGQAGGDSEESIWDSIGDLLGSIFGGLFRMIGAILSKILQALASLATMIAEKLAAVVELVLSFFDEIPKLFSGFLGFLTAVFPFLPEDIMLLLTFGIAVLVFIGIIKALRR